jgi:EAL and modified HD-GYP domain-containing signal transduction protein
LLVGRQGIFRADFSLAAYELLFRAPGRPGLRIDLWNSTQQDRATEHVIATAFHRGVDIAPGAPTFVNFTRGYLLSHEDLHCDPQRVVIEVLESAFSDDDLGRRLEELRAQGFKVAIDDFIGTRNQIELLALADYVKVDYRDLAARGPHLADLARSGSAVLVAERIESRRALQECLSLGFTLFQGHALEPAVTVQVGDAR